MDLETMDALLRNVDRRTQAIERILPTLATKVELREVVHAAVEPLPTRAEMHEAIRAAIEPLPTRTEMHEVIRAEVREEGERTRSYFDIVAENLRDDIRLIAEGQVSLAQRFETVRAELKQDIAALDVRVTRLEAVREPGSGA